MSRATHAYDPGSIYPDRCMGCPMGDSVPKGHIRHAPELAAAYLRELADAVLRMEADLDCAVRSAHLLGAPVETADDARDLWADLRSKLLLR